MDFKLNLENETIDHAHPSEPLRVAPDAATRDVIELMRSHNRGAVIVCRDEVLVGIFTERDVLRLLSADADLNVPIEQVMVARPVTLACDDTVGHAIALMSSGGYRRLPIVDDAGKPVGLIKTSGILHYLVEHFPKVIYNLPPAPHHMTQEREGA